MNSRDLRPGTRLSIAGKWLDRPLSWSWCVVGWLIATVVYVAFVKLLGGVTTGDAADSLNTTWALAHGVASCAYPPGNEYGLPYSAPLYPLMAAGVAALLGIGSGSPFPTRAMMGPHCSTAVDSMYHWSLRSHALLTTVQIGYLGWIALLAGVVALLRATGRGRRGWEPLTLLIVACVPSVAMCLQEYFHPQDLIAMGLILAGLACAIRGNWGWSGVLLGLALVSNQFALLVLGPLCVVAIRDQRTRLVTGAIGSVAIVVIPLFALTSGGVVKAALIGSGNSSVAGTLVGNLNLQSSIAQFLLSRAVPVLLSLLLALWTVKKIGRSAGEPAVMLSLVASSLALRLVFETNLWGYYFMAVAVLIIVLDVTRQRLRFILVIWLAAIMVAFYHSPHSRAALQQATPNLMPLWLWQLLLVSTAIGLAITPLISTTRARPEDLIN